MSKLETFRKFLSDNGYRPKVQDDYVTFQHEGGCYVLPIDEDDPHYFRIVFPNFWHFDTPADRTRVMETAATVTGMVKAVKIFPGPNDTIASIDLLMPSEQAFCEFFPRALLMLQNACREFSRAMRAQEPGNPVLEAIKRLFGGEASAD